MTASTHCSANAPEPQPSGVTLHHLTGTAIWGGFSSFIPSRESEYKSSVEVWVICWRGSSLKARISDLAGTCVDIYVHACGRPSAGGAMWDWSVNRGSRPFHGWDSGAFTGHDEITPEKTLTLPLAWTHVCRRHAVGGGGQDRRSWPAATHSHKHTHIFGSNMSTGGDSIDHRCACPGNSRDYCTGVCVWEDV